MPDFYFSVFAFVIRPAAPAGCVNMGLCVVCIVAEAPVRIRKRPGADVLRRYRLLGVFVWCPDSDQ